MKRAYYPRPTMCITQGYNGSYTHQGTFAIDDAGEDGGIDWFLAPFDCVVKQVLSESYGNWVWVESLEPIQCVNGYVGYLTMMIGHDNKVRYNVGDIIYEGQPLQAEGTSGHATGNHNHFELGQGQYVGTWYPNECGVYMLYNAVKPHEYLYLKQGYVQNANGGYNWTYEPIEIVTPPVVETPVIEPIVEPITPIIDNPPIIEETTPSEPIIEVDEPIIEEPIKVDTITVPISKEKPLWEMIIDFIIGLFTKGSK